MSIHSKNALEMDRSDRRTSLWEVERSHPLSHLCFRTGPITRSSNASNKPWGIPLPARGSCPDRLDSAVSDATTVEARRLQRPES